MTRRRVRRSRLLPLPSRRLRRRRTTVLARRDPPRQVYKNALGDGAALTSAGLPWVLPWKVSWPSSDVSAQTHWFARALPDYIQLTETSESSGSSSSSSDASASDSSSSSVECRVASMDFAMVQSTPRASSGVAASGSTSLDVPISVRFVQNGRAAAARPLPLAVGDLEAYVESVHARYIGEQRGWDRWLDNHIAIDVLNTTAGRDGGGYLDDVARHLAAIGVRFHAHLTKQARRRAAARFLLSFWFGSFGFGFGSSVTLPAVVVPRHTSIAGGATNVAFSGCVLARACGGG